MTHQRFENLYSRSYFSTLNADLVPTFVAFRNLYDPIPLRGDIPIFKANLEWYQNNLAIFRSTVQGEFVRDKWKGSFGRFMGTLSSVDELSGHYDRIDTLRPVAFMTGSEDWVNDIAGSTKKIVDHVIFGENKMHTLDYFSGKVEPNSTTAIIEILHQFLTDNNLLRFVNSKKSPDHDLYISLIIQAKDILYRTLMQSYLGVLRSRAHLS